MLVNHTRKYIFVHIPKCAGTTVQETLLKHSIFLNEDFTVYDFHSSIDDYEIKKLVEQNYNIIAFVRNPYSRFLSACDEIQCMTKYYKNNEHVMKDLLNKKYLIPAAPMYFFTHVKSLLGSVSLPKSIKVYKVENFRNSIIELLDSLEYPRIWWNRNVKNKERPKSSEYDKFITEFYYKDFLEFGYQMKHSVCPIIHEFPVFKNTVKYDWLDIKNNPNNLYFLAMKSTHDQEQDPRDSDLITFSGAAGPDPP